eukprot:scaffold105851_cov45-Phaeocystis_antarctica.AAC.1
MVTPTDQSTAASRSPSSPTRSGSAPTGSAPPMSRALLFGVKSVAQFEDKMRNDEGGHNWIDQILGRVD